MIYFFRSIFPVPSAINARIDILLGPVRICKENNYNYQEISLMIRVRHDAKSGNAR